MLSPLELELTAAIEHRSDELVELCAGLIRFDTTAREPDDPPRAEAALQSFLAERLAAAGAAYVPAQADEDGWGNAVEREIEERVAGAAAGDPWLAQNPPTVEWATDVPSCEVSPDEPLVGILLETGHEVGRGGRLSGLDSWHDGATFTRFGATPCVCYGPPSIADDHTIDESVAVDDVVACAQALAIATLRFCGKAAR